MFGQHSMLQTTNSRKRGESTPEGRARQIAARIGNGVHFQSPVLPNGIESQKAWDAHLASMEEALRPVGAWEKLCVYRIALSAWKHFRLVRHEVALATQAICDPDNEFKSTHDANYVHATDVAEVLARSEANLEEELSQMRELLTRVSALSTDGDGITFTVLERRQILSAIIEQPLYDTDQEDRDDDGKDGNAQEDSEPVKTETADSADSRDSPDPSDSDDSPESIRAAVLREEIKQIARAKGERPTDAIASFVSELEESIRIRGRRLKLARTHIGISLIPDERNVNRLAIYERQLDAASRRYLNDLYRAQALRLGQPVAAPIAVDVNVTGEQGNGLH
jgi:hypothetical protein